MTRKTARQCRKPKTCGCGSLIRKGEMYWDHIASPNHDDLGNTGWWRLPECAECAQRYGRPIPGVGKNAA